MRARGVAGSRSSGRRGLFARGTGTTSVSAGRPVILLLITAALPVALFLVTPCVFPRCLSAALAPWSLFAGRGIWLAYRRVVGAWGETRPPGEAWSPGETRAPGMTRAPGLARPPGEAGPPGDVRPPGDARSSRTWAISGLLLLLLIGGQVVWGRGVWGCRSGFPAAAEWLRQSGNDKCVSSQAYALRVYGIDAVSWPETTGRLADLASGGVRYALLDNQIFVSGMLSTARSLMNHLQPVAVIPHPAGGSASFIWEAPEETVAATRRRSRGGEWLRPSVILVYDLRQLPVGSE